jgi:hypothetical protein
MSRSLFQLAARIFGATNALAVTADLEEPCRPPVRRLQTLKRFILVITIIWIALISSWFVARSWAKKQLLDQIATEQAGARAEVAEVTAWLEPPHAPAEQNAVTHLRRALAYYSDYIEEMGVTWDDMHTYPLSPKGVAGLRRLVGANTESLKHLRAARSCHESRWETSFIPSALADPEAQIVSDVNRCYQLMQLENDAIMLACAQGDEAEAFEHVRDARAMLQTLNHAPLYEAQEISAGLECELSNTIENLTQSLHPPSSHATRAVSRSTITALLADLLTDGPTFDLSRKMLLADRTLHTDLLNAPPRRWIYRQQVLVRTVPSGNEIVLNTIFEPYQYWLAAREFQAITEIAQALRERNYRAARARMKTPPLVIPSQLPILRWLQMAKTDHTYFLYSQYFAATWRHMAATILAIRLYQFDHHQALPKNLRELVPQYLPSMPMDLMAAGERPIGYVAAPEPFVYSVGRDGVDDVASGIVPASNDNHSGRLRDFVSFLRPPPPPPPSPATPAPAY